MLLRHAHRTCPILLQVAVFLQILYEGIGAVRTFLLSFGCEFGRVGLVVVAVVLDALAHQPVIFGLERGDDAGGGLVFELGRGDAFERECAPGVGLGGLVIRECHGVAGGASDQGGF